MRSMLFIVAIALGATACKDPGAEVTAAKIESPTQSSPGVHSRGTVKGSLAINPSNSKIEFMGAKVTASHLGGFTDFAGTLELGEPVDASRIEVTIQTASLYADKEKLTKHLKSPDFFDVAKFPTATFRSTDIRADGAGHTITGDMTLHGVTKRISFPATIAVTDEGVRANAEFSINRQDFGIAYPGAPDDLIRDLVAIKLSIELARGA
jgi:polyisoprenoid-binding protein YceI